MDIGIEPLTIHNLDITFFTPIIKKPNGDGQRNLTISGSYYQSIG
jgi:hypothetical protein